MRIKISRRGIAALAIPLVLSSIAIASPALAAPNTTPAAVTNDGEPVVLSSGNLSLTPKFTGVDLNAYTFTGFDLGLLDKTGDYDAQKWYSPDDAVINVSNAERDDATGLWQTPATVSDPAGYTTGDSARLLLGRDTAAAAGGINSAANDAIGGLPQGPMTLVSATTPDGGRLRVMSKKATLDAPSWDSQMLASGGTQAALTAPKLNKSTYDGWAFDKAGTYCVTVSQTFAPGTSSAAEITEQATYTVVVGDLPDHVTTCGHDGDGSTDDGDGGGSPTVLSAGNLSLTPKFTGVDLGAYTFTGFDLGLLDKTGDYAGQKWYSPDDAVINVSNAERDDATGLWQTPTTVSDPSGYTTGDDARLLLGRDTAAAAGGINASSNDAIGGLPQGPMTLVSATTPDRGRLRVMSKKATLDAPSWDSQTLASGGTQAALTAPKLNKSTYDGWAFDKAGTYCVTVSQAFAPGSSSAAEITEQATYTIIVGDLPEHLTTCGHDGDGSGGDGDGGDGSGGDGSGGDGGSGDAPVTRMTTGHLDVRSWPNDAGDALNFGIYTTPEGRDTYTLSRDLVLGGTHEGTVAAPNDVSDLSFIGPVGSTYYYFSQAVSDPNKELWPGFSGENWSGGKTAAFQGLSTTLAGVTGPSGGHVILFGDPASTSDGASEPEYVYYDSAWGTPMTRTDLNASHTHMNWAFTQPGRYCLSFTTQAPLADGRTLSGAGQLTVWAGDSGDISSVEPCDRDTTPAAGSTLPAPNPAAVSSPIVSTQGLDEIQPYLADGGLKAPVQTRAQTTADAQYYDLDDTIFSTTRKIGSYYQLTQQGGASPTLRVRTDRIAPKDIDGPVTVTMGDVQGPGPVYTSSAPGAPPMLNSAADGRSLSYTQPAQSYQNLAFRVDAVGVYCIPLTWSATPKGSSSPAAVTKTITLVAGSTTKGNPDYIDRSKLKTCAHGQQATKPGDNDGSGDGPGDSGPSDADVYVPNESLTDSGAVILNDGHVDIASKVKDDTLETWVKDTTETIDPRYHPLAGSNALDSTDRNATNNGNGTVFQVLPDAQTSVPAGGSFGFLGKAGSPMWQVSQTQQDGLLWPGWSTEEIPLDATKTGVQWTLDKIAGPGEFALYETELSSVDVLYNTRDGITSADSFEIGQNAHVHGSWAFSAEGTYCLAFTRSTTMADGKKASDDFTLAVAVGRVAVKKVDPDKCFTETGKPTLQDTTPVPESQLTSATAGGVQVLGSEEGFYPGQLVTAQVGTSHAGEWVSVWLHSQPTWLGWAQVDSAGDVQVRLPVDAALGSHKLVVKTQAGELIGWDSLDVIKAPDDGSGGNGDGSGDGDGSDGSTNPVCTAGETTIISSGHLDYSTQVVNGKIESLIGDNSSGKEVFRQPSKTVLWLKPSSLAQLPPGYEQVGPAKSSVYLIPQTQNMALIWLGWSTETLNSSKVSSPVTWKLTDVDGPGSMKVFLDGQFGDFGQMVFNGTGSYEVKTGVHAHANWAFSKAGIYRLHFTQSAILANGQASSDSEVVTIVVGDVDPVTAVPGGKDCVDNKAGDTSGTIGGDDTGGGVTGKAAQTAAVCTPTKVNVISAGHLDWNTQVIGGKLESLIGDDSTGTRLYREPSSTVLWLKPASQVTLPGSVPQVGAAGSTVWQVPQTQNYDLIWLGWSTELLNAGNASSPVSWSLTGIDGPGSVKVYTVGTFGGVQEMVFNGTGTHTIALGSHVHANWAFSAQGVYKLHFTQTATLANGQRSSDSEVLTIAVGDVDPTKAISSGAGCGSISNAVLTGNKNLDDAKKAAEQAQADAAQARAGILPGRGADTDASNNAAAAVRDRRLVPLLLGILGGLLLLGAAGTGVLWWRRRRPGTPSPL